MKNFSIFALLTLTVFFAACNKNEYRHELVYVDSLAEHDAVRAKKVLDSVGTTMGNAPKHEKMYFDLLRIKVDNFLFIENKEDSTANALVEYYEKDGDENLLPQAYYYAGKVYKTLNDYPQAMDYFLNALKLVEGTNSMLESQVYNQLGYVFSRQWLDDKALVMFKKAYKCSRVQRDTVGMIFSLGDIGQCYKYKGDNKRALECKDKARLLAREYGSREWYVANCSQLAIIYAETGEYEKARKYIQPALELDDTNNRSSTYSIASDIFLATNKYDSAYWCFQQMEKYGNVYAKQAAYKGFAKYNIQKGNAVKALRYLEDYEHYTDSIQSITATEAIQQKESLYNYKLREEENKRLKEENKTKNAIILFVCSFGALAVVMAITVFLYSKEKQKVYKLKLDKYSLIAEREVMKQTPKGNIEETEIYKDIQQMINNPQSKMRITDEQWAVLAKAVNEECHGFDQKLSELCRMSLQDYRLCLLIRINIPLSKIAEFVSLSKSGVTSARAKLYKRAFGISGSASQWDSVIHSL